MSYYVNLCTGVSQFTSADTYKCKSVYFCRYLQVLVSLLLQIPTSVSQFTSADIYKC